MSQIHDPHADVAYGSGGRSGRPLIFLIPIGIALAVCLAMLGEGLHIVTTPADSSAGQAHIAQTTAPAGAS